jgi:hypothetical protein
VLDTTYDILQRLEGRKIISITSTTMEEQIRIKMTKLTICVVAKTKIEQLRGALMFSFA